MRSNIHGLNYLQERAADLAALFSLTFHSTDFMLTHPRHPLPIARPLIYTSAESAGSLHCVFSIAINVVKINYSREYTEKSVRC